MARADAVERKLWAIAEYRAAEFGFAPNCRALLEGLVRAGVLRLAAEGRLDDEDAFAIAAANLVRFVSEMILEARRLGYTELHEDTYGKAHSSFCPLWPFC